MVARYPRARSAARSPRTVGRCVLICSGLLAAVHSAHGQREAGQAPQGVVRSDTMWSQSLGALKVLTVYLPPSYATAPGKRYPLLVYLHGLGGNERNWIDAGRLPRTLDSLAAATHREAIVVMPDGDDGWYTTWNGLADVAGCQADTVRRERAVSYCVPWQHYDDYIARDLVAHVDQRYRTTKRVAERGIGGLSMGGYGAVTLALTYPDVFSAAASHSGVLSPRLLAPATATVAASYAGNSSQLEAVSRGLWRSLRPAFGKDTIGWAARDPRTIVARSLSRRASSSLPALYLDCGIDDAYLLQNRDFHQTLLRLGVSHHYAEHPGAHTWSYWSAHAAESLDFLLQRVGAH